MQAKRSALSKVTSVVNSAAVSSALVWSPSVVCFSSDLSTPVIPASLPSDSPPQAARATEATIETAITATAFLVNNPLAALAGRARPEGGETDRAIQA